MFWRLGAMGGAALFLTGAAPAGRVDVPDGCALVRIGPDGTAVRGKAVSSAGRASAAASGSGSRSRSVSSSSSSSSRGGGKARSVASTTVDGRTITTVHDGDRCTVTVEDR